MVKKWDNRTETVELRVGLSNMFQDLAQGGSGAGAVLDKRPEDMVEQASPGVAGAMHVYSEGSDAGRGEEVLFELRMGFVSRSGRVY